MGDQGMLRPRLALIVLVADWLALFSVFFRAYRSAPRKPAKGKLMRTSCSRGLTENDKMPTRSAQDTYDKTRILYDFLVLLVAFWNIQS